MTGIETITACTYSNNKTIMLNTNEKYQEHCVHVNLKDKSLIYNVWLFFCYFIENCINKPLSHWEIIRAKDEDPVTYTNGRDQLRYEMHGWQKIKTIQHAHMAVMKDIMSNTYESIIKIWVCKNFLLSYWKSCINRPPSQ